MLRILGNPGAQPLRTPPPARTAAKRSRVPDGGVDRLYRTACGRAEHLFMLNEKMRALPEIDMKGRARRWLTRDVGTNGNS